MMEDQDIRGLSLFFLIQHYFKDMYDLDYVFSLVPCEVQLSHFFNRRAVKSDNACIEINFSVRFDEPSVEDGVLGDWNREQENGLGQRSQTTSKVNVKTVITEIYELVLSDYLRGIFDKVVH